VGPKGCIFGGILLLDSLGAGYSFNGSKSMVVLVLCTVSMF